MYIVSSRNFFPFSGMGISLFLKRRKVFFRM